MLSQDHFASEESGCVTPYLVTFRPRSKIEIQENLGTKWP